MLIQFINKINPTHPQIYLDKGWSAALKEEVISVFCLVYIFCFRMQSSDGYSLDEKDHWRTNREVRRKEIIQLFLFFLYSFERFFYCLIDFNMWYLFLIFVFQSEFSKETNAVVKLLQVILLAISLIGKI